jgi:outer membrane protein OmpA-like peptidoglycan-associated protein
MFTLARTGFLCAVLAALPQIGAAQSMTAEEILKRIQLQREAKVTAAEEERTRALKFTGGSVPATTGTEAAAVVPTPGTPTVAEAPAGTLTAPGTETGPATPASADSGQRPALVEAALKDAPPALPPPLSIDLVVFFEFDSATLRRDARAQLGELCGALEADTGTYSIIGHTDAAGADTYNLRLSRARAEEVVRYLVAACGLDSGRFQAFGLGEERLKDLVDPRSGTNRRVEIQVAS